MLRNGICSVEGSFKIFLTLDDKDHLPLVWLSKAIPKKVVNSVELKDNSYKLIIMSKRN